MLVLTEQKIARLLPDIRASIYRERHPISVFRFREGDFDSAEAVDYDASAWASFRLGDTWGGYDVVAWFRARVPIPAYLKSLPI